MSQHRRFRMIRLGAIAATAAGALILAGCSGSGASPADTQQDTHKFALAFPVSNQVKTSYQVLAEKYMKEHAGVTITFNGLPGESYAQTIRTQLQGGNASDVFFSAPGSGEAYSILPLAKAGLIVPLGETATSLIPRGSESGFVVDGKTYGQAMDIEFVGNVFNTMPGVAYSSDFQGMLDTCKTLAAEKKSLFIVAGSVPANTTLMAQAIAATRVYAKDPNWDAKRIAGKVTFAGSQGWKDTLKTILTMKDAGCFQAGVEGAGFDAITNGLTQGAGLSMFGPGSVAAEINAAAQGHAKFVIEAFPAAKASDKRFALASSTFAFSIAASSKNKVAAQKFLDWMAQPAQAKALADDKGTLPVSGIKGLNLDGTPYSEVEDILKSGDYTPWPASMWPNAGVSDALGTGVQGLFTGQKTVDQVLADMDSAWGN